MVGRPRSSQPLKSETSGSNRIEQRKRWNGTLWTVPVSLA